MICKRCGTNINTTTRESDGSVVCPGCGAKYRPKSSEPPVQKSFTSPPNETRNLHFDGKLDVDKASNRPNSWIKAAVIALAAALLFGGVLTLIHSHRAENTPTGNDSAHYEGAQPAKTESQSKNTVRTSIAYDDLFADGLLMAKSESGLWGYINREGDWVVAPQYKSENSNNTSNSAISVCCEFSNGVAAVRDGSFGCWGVLDSEGKYIFEPMFLSKPVFSGDRAVVQDASSGLWGQIDNKGNWTIAPAFSGLSMFSEGVAAACDPSSNLWGYIDLGGDWVIEPKYTEAFPFENGLAVVQDSDYMYHYKYASFAFVRYLYGYIDKNGNYAILPMFDYASSFHEGMAVVQDPDTETWGYINVTGDVVIPFSFMCASSFSEGRAFVGTYSEKKYDSMIDTNGEEFVDYPGGCYPISGEESGEHDKPRYLWSGEYMLVRENGGSERYVINKEGKIMPGCVIDDISPREILTDDGLVLMRNAQKKVGVISVDGTWLLEPEYSKISVFDNRILAYRSAEDGKILCVFDLLGNMIFPDNSSGNSNQGDVYIYPVSKMMDEKMKYGYMDVRGKLVIGYQYDQTSLFSTDLGVAFAVKDGYSGIIDTNGNWIIPPKFKGFMHPQMETLSF